MSTLRLISQGASEINISCVIEQKQSDRAINAIHDKLIVGTLEHVSAAAF